MRLDSRALPHLLLAPLLLALSPLGAASPIAQEGRTRLELPGQERNVETPTANADAADTSAPLKRVLIYSGGRAVRGLTRMVNTTWELRRAGEWVPLGSSAPLSHRAEAELLTEARALAKQAPSSDLAARNAYAMWLVRVGLHSEAGEVLDGILKAEPDNAQALAQLQAPAFLPPKTKRWLDAPEDSATALMQAARPAGPVQRELLITSLGNLHQACLESGVVRKRVLAGLFANDVAERSFAAHALRRLFPGEALEPLIRRSVLDVSGTVRREAALALRMADEPGLALPLVKALGSQSRAVRTNAAESLGTIGYSNAVPSLVKHYAGLSSSGGVMPITSHIRIGAQLAYIQDFDVEIAQGSSIADPIVRNAHDVIQLEARVGGISGYTYVTEKRTIYRSLKQLTGEDPGSTPKAWSQWMEGQGRDEL